jgi:hypothetical protein
MNLTQASPTSLPSQVKRYRKALAADIAASKVTDMSAYASDD